ncbi:MAG: hypothetical protein K2L07_14755 [Lachnospiraceae bacterium]|nr:hypothetical protein [Lachnospiraceae bacterium]
MNSEHKKLVRLAEKLLYVYSAQCTNCSSTFDYAVESADTDMISCYCGSVYSLGDRQLVIAPITAEEFSNGLSGRLDKRINAIYPTHDYKFYNYVAKICPFCGKHNAKNLKEGCSIKEYCVLHPNTLIIYEDKTIRVLKDEIDASYD